ncbi:uncharacterized protein TNIN_451321 [Trichonephila inaurata madagascariensis]|uniref:Uncharacterized protein n=1 Tax=Trichonephila inaurata madagascariensis TaxID=2747483 RepID=A0A8X7CV66_9ARAC|nr:uncharacterized protein TNIN_451321 [Trichonephila inaurata madagascariensis]
MGNRHTGGGGDVAAGDVGGDSAGDVDGVDVVDGVDDGDGDDATACSNPHRGWECNSPESTPRWVGIWDHCTKDRVRFQAPTAATRPLLVRRRCHARTIECQPDGPSGAPCARGVATTFQRTPFPPSGPQTGTVSLSFTPSPKNQNTARTSPRNSICRKKTPQKTDSKE